MKTLIWLLVVLVLLVAGPTIALVKSYAATAPPPPKRDFRVRLIEAVLLAEARGEGPEGVRLVAEVIRNRARKLLRLPVYIVQEPHQFSCLNGKTPETLIDLMERSVVPADVKNMAQRCAYRLVFPDSHGRAFKELDYNFANGATHYHAAGVQPSWASGRKPCKTYKNHIFYKL
jgi:hypothetical protein